MGGGGGTFDYSVSPGPSFLSFWHWIFNIEFDLLMDIDLDLDLDLDLHQDLDLDLGADLELDNIEKIKY